MSNSSTFQLNFSKGSLLPWSKTELNNFFHQSSSQSIQKTIVPAFEREESGNYYFQNSSYNNVGVKEEEANEYAEQACSPSHKYSEADDKQNYDELFGDDSASYNPSQDYEDSNEVLSNGQENPKKLSKINQSQQRIMRQWNETDDKLLLKLGVQYKNDWKKINQKFEQVQGKKVTPYFLKNRYREISKPQGPTKKIKFNHEDDLKIVKIMVYYDLHWVKISKFFDNVDPISIKNRYYSSIKKKELYDELLAEANKRRDLDFIDQTIKKELGSAPILQVSVKHDTAKPASSEE